jgi:hypothetical protein
LKAVKRGLDDIARAVSSAQARNEGQDRSERNEYLVDQLHPLQRVRGKQDNVITIEVRVLWQKVDGREYWRRPYVTTVTFAELRRKPDALWMLLTRCLPFKEWKYVDWSTGEFIERFYKNDVDKEEERLTAEEEEDREDWWDDFAYNRLPREPWVVGDDGETHRQPNEMAEMKEALRELVSEEPEEYGILSNYEKYSPEHLRKVARCWFVISAVPDGSWT